MSQPKPPQPAWVPTEQNAPPIASPLRIEDVSPFIDPLDPPVVGAASGDNAVLCDRCTMCWKMSVAGQFKNTRSDGSDYVLTERFCVFKDSLISLAERNVRECSRFVKKD
jgi:hypothetical protein